MKRLALVLAAIVSFVLPAGAQFEPAPVLPTRNFYVNDYAGVIADEHRDRILGFCQELYERTGAQVVVVTAKDFDELDSETYGRLIMQNWDIGSPEEQNGVLLLVSSKGEVRIFHGEGLRLDTRQIIDEYMGKAMKNANYSKGITEGAKAIIRQVYEAYGITPGEELAYQFQPEGNTVFTPTAAVLLVGVLLLLGRTWRVSAKYRRRYGKGYVYPRKDFSPPSRAEEDRRVQDYRYDD